MTANVENFSLCVALFRVESIRRCSDLRARGTHTRHTPSDQSPMVGAFDAAKLDHSWWAASTMDANNREAIAPRATVRAWRLCRDQPVSVQ